MPHRATSSLSAMGGARRWLAAVGVLLGMNMMAAGSLQARCCVWKVTDGSGHTMYLAGSVHALRASDYPLPAAYDQAFAASSGLAFETDVDKHLAEALGKAAILPPGVHLKDRVDPRTYAYILRVIANVHGSTAPEQKIDRLRPWALALLLESPGGVQGISHQSGVESYLLGKNAAAHKRTAGLVPFAQHVAVFGGMNDADSEAVLLLAFIHLNTGGKDFERTVASWKRGDIDDIDKIQAADYQDAPSLQRRMLTDRNQAWLPRIDGFLRSGQTWMVVAGTGHMAGREGVPALLAARGYKVEQL